ncbi:family 78 glycoside hydrolase catalytic domain [Streptomyces sp. NPDC097610]|uniref:family 78 glycoside hydrolase catalytic domain n=1 Tax=Streptomyces sp. NPDC097610 TaxID=3157227 RepID=UPI0033191959
MNFAVRVHNLTTEYQSTPFPLDVDSPRLGWQLLSDRRGVSQDGYEIRVTAMGDPRDLDTVAIWETGRVTSSQSIGVPYAGPVLKARTRYRWTARVWAGGDQPTDWAEPSWWETGLMAEGWRGRWIEPEQHSTQPDAPCSLKDTPRLVDAPVDHALLQPAQLIRTEFTARPGLVRARLYASAHGIYTAELNGDRIGNIELAPETTAYQDFLMYQGYDVTGQIAPGRNALGFVLADGWWAGRLGMYGKAANYGDRLGLITQLELHYDDGAIETVASGDGFRSSTGPVVYADLLIGQKVDARLALPGWSSPGFDDTGWTPVHTLDLPMENLTAQLGEPVRVIAELPCVEVTRTPDGGQILDFGQLITGRLRVRFDGLAPGTEIRLQHFQVKDADGDCYRSIYGRNNENTDVYVAAGADEVFEPLLTFHAFRYVKVTGLEADFDPTAVVARALSSDVDQTFQLRTSDPRVNRLQDNIRWTLRDNFLSIPTDNPDRERAGWTGDLAAIAGTARVNLGIDRFVARFMRSLRADQFDDGTVPMIIPFFKGYRELFQEAIRVFSCAGWGDVAVILPWETYRAYGDVRLLEENYQAATRFLEYVTATASKTVTDQDREDSDLSAIWRATGLQFGDWLAPSTTGLREDRFYDGVRGPASTGLIPTLYYTHSTDILADWAHAIGRRDDESRLRELAARLRRGFRKAFIGPDGSLSIDTQSNYVLALAFHMAPDLEKTFAVRLRELVTENDGRLDTGFLATAHLLPVLSDHGLNDLAYALLLDDRYPSWLYMLRHDATAMWEMWKAIEEDGTPTRVSYVQPGLGSVGNWLATHAAGIQECAPGYSRIRLHPRPGPGLDRLESCFGSVYGPITVSWAREADDHLRTAVLIPANTSATIILDGARLDETRLDRFPVAGHPNVVAAIQDGHRVVLEVGSGRYEFTYREYTIADSATVHP